MNIKSKNKFIAYLIYIIIFILFLKYGYEYGFYNLQRPGSKYLEYYLFGRPVVWAYLAFYFALIDLMLALPRFMNTIKESGVWKFDWIVFLAVCVPSLYVSITPRIPLEWVHYWPLRDYLGQWGGLFQNLTVTLFTYFFITSFNKSEAD
ncbi:hypothetical protein [Syntrophomonas curvata]